MLNLDRLKQHLAKLVRDTRRQKNITQVELAEQIGSSQSRVAKLESSDQTISFDLYFRALSALDVNLKQINAAWSQE